MSPAWSCRPAAVEPWAAVERRNGCGRGWLAYDNRALPQALILTGMATKMRAYVDATDIPPALAGLPQQNLVGMSFPGPVGTSPVFGRNTGNIRARFDQQPVEATGDIAAMPWRLWRLTADKINRWKSGREPRFRVVSRQQRSVAGKKYQEAWSNLPPELPATICTPRSCQ